MGEAGTGDRGTEGTKLQEDMGATDHKQSKNSYAFFIPLWQANLIFFAILFLLTVSYFVYQINNSQKLFIKDAKEHARLVAGVLTLHIKGAVLSRKIIEENMVHFLGNTARFVAYLDSIEPFTSVELESFAKESGLVGICLVRNDGDQIQGPRSWMPQNILPFNLPKGSLKHYKDIHMVIYRSDESPPLKDIFIGIDASSLEELCSKIGLQTILSEAEKLNGINYIRLDTRPDPTFFASNAPPFTNTYDAEISFKGSGPQLTAELTVPFGKGHLIVGLDATTLLENKQRLWRDFRIFTFVLALVGGVLSYLLYRQQMSHLADARRYERELALRREEATLGRSAAAIAHEIRNPLNAMAIALQRLKVEATGLHQEHKHLLTVLLDSVKRTNNIIEGLLSYAKLPQNSMKEKVNLSNLIKKIIDLYKGRIKDANINLKQDVAPDIYVQADRTLLTQVLENVLLNAIEAQPTGGTITINLHKQNNRAILTVRNPGEIPSKSDMDKIFAPYFTLKTRGTGLGLAIIEKIVKAHEGTVSASILNDNEFQIKIQLPMDTQ